MTFLSTDKVKLFVRYDSLTGIFVYKQGRKAGCIANSSRQDGYIRIYVAGKRYYAHRLAWFLSFGTWPTKDIDHKDQNVKNNSIKNLREATKKQNQANVSPRKGTSSKFKGVTKRKRDGKYAVQIGTKEKYIGLFDNEISAAIAYDIEAIKRYGEFACTNFPKENYD